jgi:hypothetical protein
MRVLLAAAFLGIAQADTALACGSLPAPTDQVLDGRVVTGGGLLAYYAQPTTRYAHGVLGDAVEAGELVVDNTLSAAACGDRIVLPADRVFEDVAPRLVDLDGDQYPEIITVESQKDLGAQLAIYGYRQGAYDKLIKRAAPPHIGTPNRWLAPIGAADLDGDGYVELAYIDRPHLAKTLRVWRFRNEALEEVASLPGLTNHRIGERDIGGGIRDCGQGPEMVTASANWRQVMATRLSSDGTLSTRAIRPHQGRASLEAALSCED